MKSNYRKIGDFIELVDERNKDLVIELLLGLSVTKEFIPSVANTIGTNMKNYKVIKKGQFACSVMQVRRDKKMPVALLQDFDEAIISQAYPVFQIKDETQLLPEYLMMWFTRSEFDREACFHAVGGVRGSLEWEDFLNMELPVPSIEKQNKIVKEYNIVINRIKLNEQLNQKLEETAQALYKHWFVDFNFPITKESYPELVSESPELEGKPYKSSDGEMVYNEELDKEIPLGWNMERLVDISQIKGGKRMPSGSSLIKNKTNHTYIKVADLGKYKYVQFNDKFEFVPEDVAQKISRYITHKNDVIISIVGTIGVVKILGDSLDGANLTENCMKITELKKISPSYLYHFFVSNEGREEIQIRNVGAVQAKLPMYNIESFPILIPNKFILKKFNELIYDLDKRINFQIFQTKKLAEVQSLLLAKMTKVEIKKN